MNIDELLKDALNFISPNINKKVPTIDESFVDVEKLRFKVKLDVLLSDITNILMHMPEKLDLKKLVKIESNFICRLRKILLDIKETGENVIYDSTKAQVALAVKGIREIDNHLNRLILSKDIDFMMKDYTEEMKKYDALKIIKYPANKEENEMMMKEVNASYFDDNGNIVVPEGAVFIKAK